MTGAVSRISCQQKCRGENMKGKSLSATGNSLAATFSPAQAQQPTKVPRIGFFVDAKLLPLTGPHRGIPAGSARAWVRGREKHCHRVAICRGKTRTVRALAAELVRLKVDVIVTAGPAATRPAKEATATIPIVMALITIRLETGSSPALRDLAGTLLDCQPLPRR